MPESGKIDEKWTSGYTVRVKPGEILVPTPILKRTRTCFSDNGRDLPADLSKGQASKCKNNKAPRSRYAADCGSVDFEAAEIMRQWKKTGCVGRFKLYEGIYNSLEALLKAMSRTPERALLSTCGSSRRKIDTLSSAPRAALSRSLFSMCLRTMPTSITDAEYGVEAKGKAMDENSAFDTCAPSAEVYTELESLGTSQVGWKYLEEVVRTHGVLLISDAVKDGLIDAGITSALVILCTHTSFPDEAENLLTSLLKSSVYPEPESYESHFRDSPSLLPLSMLERFVRQTGHMCYYYRQVSSIISGGLLSIKWLGTRQFGFLWTSLFRSLSADPFDRDATNFMITALPLLCRVQSPDYSKHELLPSNNNSMLSVLETTLASALTTLLAMSILSARHSNISQILKSSIIDCQLLSSNLRNDVTALIAMANLIVGLENDEDAGFLEQLVNLLMDKPLHLNSAHLNDRIPSLICSVARCCGRGSAGDVFEHLKLILERLTTFASSKSPQILAILQQIVVESALVFADQIPDSKHVKYAQHLRANMRRPLCSPESSRVKGKVRYEVGFRWEEGIDEWVMTTPVVRLKEFQDQELFAANENPDCESPIRPNQGQPNFKTAFHIRSGVCSYPSSRISDLVPNSPEGDMQRMDPVIQKDYLTQDEDFRTYSFCEIPGPKRPKPNRKRFIKVPRLGHKHLHSRNWMLFDFSDDELTSSIATETDTAQDVLQESLNPMRSSKKSQRTTTFKLHDSVEGFGRFFREQSEDELRLQL